MGTKKITLSPEERRVHRYTTEVMFAAGENGVAFDALLKGIVERATEEEKALPTGSRFSFGGLMELIRRMDVFVIEEKHGKTWLSWGKEDV